MGETLPSPPGDIRAFDVRTGKLRWSFHTIPHPGEFGYDTWPKDAWMYSGSANNWAGMTVDEKRGLVFAPTGSAAFDFYGANRARRQSVRQLAARAERRYRRARLALSGGAPRLWDRDFPAPPNLVTVERDGTLVDAVAQITKSGHVYVFERETGKPLFPIEEREVSPDGADGEYLAPKQPLPLKPPPFARQILTEDMLTQPHAGGARRRCWSSFRKVRSAGQFVPPSLRGDDHLSRASTAAANGAARRSIPRRACSTSTPTRWPGSAAGGAAEGGRHARAAATLYMKNCATCHREDLKGTPPEFPSLVEHRQQGTRSRRSCRFIREGAGRMPGFPQLPARGHARHRAVCRHRRRHAKWRSGGHSQYPIELKYVTDGYNKFLDPDGYPAIAPPWGTLNAIDLNNGEIAWKIPFGEYPELAAKGMRNTGSENYGGPVVTAGGLLFIGATNHDRKFHAYDKATGKLLWETPLPAAATPRRHI